MFKKLQRKRISKQIEREINTRDRSNLNNKVKTVGVLYNGDEIKEVSFFNALVSGLKISEEKVSFLGFVTFDKKETSLPKHLFTKKDFSWSGDLKGDAVKQFVAKNIDVLIVYNDSENQYLDLVVAKSKAVFKIGCVDGDERLYDLILAEKISNTKSFNTEIVKYLRILGKL